MTFVVELFVQVALLFLGWKLWRWAKSNHRAGKTKWRRRMGLLLYLAPFLLWVASWLLPDALQGPVELFSALSAGLDKWVGFTISSTEGMLEKRNVGTLFQMAVKPIVHAVVYGGLGVLIGWPIDKLRASKDDEEGEAAPESAEA